jgi:hypothetical protein
MNRTRKQNYKDHRLIQRAHVKTISKNLINNIDKTNYKIMHGKFSIKYDMLSTHYKHNYKKIFEYDDSNL